jgi:hypothetical protein
MRILEGIHYVNQEAPNVYSANDMTRRMTDRLFVARVTFMFVLWIAVYTSSTFTDSCDSLDGMV